MKRNTGLKWVNKQDRANKNNLQILEQILPKNTHKRKQFLSMKILFEVLAIKGIPTNLSVLPKRTQI